MMIFDLELAQKVNAYEQRHRQNLDNQNSHLLMLTNQVTLFV